MVGVVGVVGVGGVGEVGGVGGVGGGAGWGPAEVGEVEGPCRVGEGGGRPLAIVCGDARRDLTAGTDVLYLFEFLCLNLKRPSNTM